MIDNDYKKEHQSLLTHIEQGDLTYNRFRETRTVRALVLAGFLTREKVQKPDGTVEAKLELTEAGHRYLAGLWY
jgi:hypothetical protein